MPVDESAGDPGQMTKGSLNRLFTLVVVTTWATLAGCHSSSPNLRLGERAERHGRYHVAYQYYCDAAKRYPSDRNVQTAISRAAPRAALHYERRAARAVEAENYADAWRWYMQALTITPDDTAIAGMIKMLEQHHAEEVASAKAAWRRHGEASLAVRSQSQWPPPSAPPVDSTEESYHVRGAAGPGPERQATSDPDPLHDPRRRAYSATEQPPQDARRGRDLSDVPADPESPIEPTWSDDLRDKDEGRGAQSDERAEGPVYLMTAILSVEDRRYPRRTHTFDDIHVRLNSDPDADLDVYVGTQRVRKMRDIKPGQSVRVEGRSGRRYEVVVITIVDRTESVRIGIRPDPVTRQ